MNIRQPERGIELTIEGDRNTLFAGKLAWVEFQATNSTVKIQREKLQ